MKHLAWTLPLLTAMACGGPPPSGPAQGEAYFKALNCSSCHRIGEAGSRGGGPDLTFVGFRHKREWLELFLRDPAAWKKDSPMAALRIPPGAVLPLVDYLATLRGRPHSAKTGRELFAKAGCSACHGRGGKGGFPNNNVRGGLVPAIDAVSRTFTRDELVKKIALGVKPQKEDPKGRDPLIEMPAWNDVLSDGEIKALADYLLSLKPSTPDLDW